VVISNITRYALPESTREDYLSSYEGDRFVESMRYVRAYPTELPALAHLLPGIQTPAQIISGARDPAMSPVNGEFLHERLPKSKLEVIDVGYSRGRTPPTSTQRWSPAGGATATRPPDADRKRRWTNYSAARARRWLVHARPPDSQLIARRPTPGPPPILEGI
jgi:hypothetical protein